MINTLRSSALSQRRWKTNALALVLGTALMAAAPAAHASEAGTKAGPVVGSTVRTLVKQPKTKVRYTTAASSPFVCTISGFGKKGGCFRR
jgi:hypothetical protein